MSVDPSLEKAIVALTVWRENRGGGTAGMQSVLNVINNRAVKHGNSMYEQAIKPLQFSSVTTKGDPELTLYPAPDDPQMSVALSLVSLQKSLSLHDITDGATVYYNPRGLDPHHSKDVNINGKMVAFPDSWDLNKLKFTTEIAGHLFFEEV